MVARFLLLPLLLVATAGAAAGDAGEWLERMSRAARELNYEGTFVYQRNGVTETLHIVHKADENGEKERLTALNGTAREVLRDGERVTCILPDDQSVIVAGNHPRGPFTSTLAAGRNRLDEGYRTQLAENPERVAGLSARRLELIPRDTYRYGHRLWLEEGSGILVRSELVDVDGTPLESMMFTDLHIGEEISAGSLDATLDGRTLPLFNHEGEEEPGRVGGWHVTRLPPGFTLGMDRRQRLPHREKPVEHMVFSDGLASVSVFIEERDGGESGLNRMGAVHAFSTNVTGHHITVVGEVPAETVRLIGESLRPLEPKP